MPAVCEQGHGTKGDAAGNFENHHDGSQCDGPACPAFTVSAVGGKVVVMYPVFESMRMHCDEFVATGSIAVVCRFERAFDGDAEVVFFVVDARPVFRLSVIRQTLSSLRLPVH